MRDRVIAWLKNNVSSRRLQHILGVEQTCIELARCHNLDTDKAATAGLMHDLAKFFPPDKLLKMAAGDGMSVDEICAANPHLLHAEVGAIVARKEFAIEDSEILAAIANHTLGNSQMSELSCVVYIADVIEPNRGDSIELRNLRKVACQNLYQCVRQSSDYSIKHLLDRAKTIHPRTISMRNWALAKEKQI
ncbi:bis(5'-nucleosyl)-tetraphosphatase (symmetrical) YqeK [Myxosarcina sp. GI1]|uniref:bis(5'-nucleosyl)-tetraphosphatase (symmetrical) YqeK n=1 Tax=Myxosarcina sp. GI1 TaxID=1541065 RepID=UPI00055F62BA